MPAPVSSLTTVRPSPLSLADQVRASQADAKRLITLMEADFLRSVRAWASEAQSIAEMDGVKVGVIEIARQMAETLEAKANSLQIVMERGS